MGWGGVGMVVNEITGAKASSSAMARESGLLKERTVKKANPLPSQDGKGGSVPQRSPEGWLPGAVCILVRGSNTT